MEPLIKKLRQSLKDLRLKWRNSMTQKKSTSNQIDDYFKAMSEGTLGERKTYLQLFAELTSTHKSVSRKDIIRGLVKKLEMEKDVTKADIYRNILEQMHETRDND